MKIEDYEILTFHESEYGTVLRGTVYCADGFNVSIQASQFHYCSPRVNCNNHESFELGFPSEEDSLIMKYAEIKEIPTQTVYGWVPCSIVNELIEKHGGIDVVKTFSQYEITRKK